jgi:hypothetical protein
LSRKAPKTRLKARSKVPNSGSTTDFTPSLQLPCVYYIEAYLNRCDYVARFRTFLIQIQIQIAFPLRLPLCRPLRHADMVE